MTLLFEHELYPQRPKRKFLVTEEMLDLVLTKRADAIFSIVATISNGNSSFNRKVELFGDMAKIVSEVQEMIENYDRQNKENSYER